MPADSGGGSRVGGCALSLASDEHDPLDVLAGTPATISELVGPRDGALLRNRLPRAAASVEELVGHLLDTELAFSCSAWTSLLRESPEWEGGNISFWETLPKPPLEDVVRAFGAIRRGNLLLLRPAAISAETKPGSAANTLPFEVRMLAGHDLAHLQDMRRILDGVAWTPGHASAACRAPRLRTKAKSGTPRAPGEQGGSPA